MPFKDLGIHPTRVKTPFPLHKCLVTDKEWTEVALSIAQIRGRLVTLWARQGAGKTFSVSVVYFISDRGLLWLELGLKDSSATYPDLSSLFPSATRMQRAIFDLLGIMSSSDTDTRPWLSHGNWGEDQYPLLRNFTDDGSARDNATSQYDFVEVAGIGVHEIAVGPVHAGIIEPGHFRFSVVGEKTLRLEERLGYTHKGVDKRFHDFQALDGYRLAGRMSGDSTVAYDWAYCMALESAWQWKVPARATSLRAILLERERIANHCGDLGALGNDAGFTFGLTQFMRLKELTLRLNKELFGHRFMMDTIIPGGICIDLDEVGLTQIREQCEYFENQVHLLRDIYEDHSGLQDRFIGTGKVAFDLAQRLGLTGMAGRASGVLEDARKDCASAPYDAIEVRLSQGSSGDVAARVAIRFDEIFESLRLIQLIISALPEGGIRSKPPQVKTAREGAGWVEGWRGGIFVALRVEKTGVIERCHVHDPSWQNWPVLEYAVIGDIVPDFPLINKSFNLTYSGHDR